VQFGVAHVRVVQETGELVANPEWAMSLGCPAGSRWLRISSLRLNGRSGIPPVG
jgi:GntR family transcriptional regulator